MWFVLGLVTLTVSIAAFAWRRWQDRWVGQRRGTLTWREDRNAKSKELKRVRARVPCDATLDFELKSERGLDRFFKRLGLSVEMQLGRLRFDEAFYVVADDPAVETRLRASPRLADALLPLLEKPPTGFRLRRIVCRRGDLSVTYKATGNREPEHLLRWLDSRIVTAAAHIPPQPGAASRLDPMLLRSALLLGASSGLALSGGLHVFRSTVGSFPLTVDRMQLWVYAFPLGAAVLAVLVLLTIVFLGRTSRAHLVLVEVLLVGGFGAIATAWTGLRDYNREADPGPAQVVSTQVTERYINRGRRGRKFHHLVFADWTGRDARWSVHVSAGEYDQWAVGDPVLLRQHPGALGVRWVESYSRPAERF